MPSKGDHIRKQYVITIPQEKLFTALNNATPKVPMFLNIDKNMSCWQEIGTENFFFDFYDLKQYCKDLKLSTSFTFFPMIKYPDIWIPSKKLCIEIDGKSHEGREQKDIDRDKWFERAGVTVIHIRNDEINSEKKLQAVVKRIIGEYF